MQLAYYSGMDDENRSTRFATLDTHGRLPTSDLAVETMTLAPAVSTQCTLAFGEGPDRLGNFFKLGFKLLPLRHIRKMLWCEIRHVAW